MDGRRQWPTEGAGSGDRWGCQWGHAAQLQQGRSSTAPGSFRLERAWRAFLGQWDDAVEARIKAQQRDGLIPRLNARRIANALNELDAAVLAAEFGRRPQGDPRAVLDTLHRIWVGTLYGRPLGKLAPERPGRKRRS